MIKQETLVLAKIETKYCDYLRQFDSKVPYNFDKKEIRPFIGVLFQVNNCLYFAPLSSPKPKHQKLKGKLDFLKLDNGKLGAINFNNMIPVTEDNVILIDLNNPPLASSEKKYNKLLKEQLYWLNRNNDKVYGRSLKLYNKYKDGTLESAIKNRCCNFMLLEEKCEEYTRNNNCCI